jgi:hypothetical protein
MTLGGAVDVAIGLILCYLLLGLIGSALQEALAGWMNLRGSKLRNGLQRLLAHGSTDEIPEAWLFSRVFQHALIRPSTQARAPSYVPAANFSASLIDVLRDGSGGPLFSQVEGGVAALPDGAAKEALTALLVRSRGDLDQFQAAVEQWFDDAMDRVSGIYKRWANNFMLIFGVLISVGANVDTVSIAQTLWGDPAARARVVAVAQEKSAAQPNRGAGVSAADLQALPIPLGWDAKTTIDFPKLIGWLITALAVSLGAPFWFDTLQKFLNIRLAGPKPERSDASG